MNELKIAHLFKECKKVPTDNYDELIDAEQAVIDSIVECLDVDSNKASRILYLMDMAYRVNR